ncbi:hypothetical protein J3459_022516 [Metarhizium acridum]|nr:hypothetical protein J3459_022516 [Metarhizium acridum]
MKMSSCRYELQGATHCEALLGNQGGVLGTLGKDGSSKKEKKKSDGLPAVCVTDEYCELVNRMFSLALRWCHKRAQLANGHCDTTGCSQDNQQASVEMERNQRVMGDGVHSSTFVSITPGVAMLTEPIVTRNADDELRLDSWL